MLTDDFWDGDPRAAFRKGGLLDINPLGRTIKRRILYKPNQAMRDLHRKLIAHIREVRANHVSAVIAPVRLSPLKNVRVHRSGRFFLLFDFKSAYGHVDLDRMADVLAAFSPDLQSSHEQVRAFLQRYCFADEGGLATGAPASPDLFNLYAGKIVDEPVTGLLALYAAQGRRIQYTRYLDDLTFSAKKQRLGSSFRWRLREIFKHAGFELRRVDGKPPFDLRKGPIVITGLRVEWKGRIFVPRHFVQLFRSTLRQAIHLCHFEDEFSIEKMAGMYGVFCSALHREQPPTQLEQEVFALWRDYRKLRKLTLRSRR
mgnify:FL=1